MLVDNPDILSHNFEDSCIETTKGKEIKPLKNKMNNSSKLNSEKVNNAHNLEKSDGVKDFGAARSCVSEFKIKTNNSETLRGFSERTNSSIAGIRNGTATNATVIGGENLPVTSGIEGLAGVCTTLTVGGGGGGGGGSNSLHYASSPLSQVYSQPYYSPAHSWHPNSSRFSSSWGATLHSQV